MHEIRIVFLFCHLLQRYVQNRLKKILNSAKTFFASWRGG